MASKKRHHCKNKPDAFCYIYGCYTLTLQRRNISLFVKRAYKAYFEVYLGDQEEQWAPHVVLHNCEEMLRDRTKGKRKGRRWVQKDWPIRDTLESGMPNIIQDPIVSSNKIIFPPLHIKLGLMKQFVKALETEGECFQHIIRTLPGLSLEKIKASVFDGPQLITLMRDDQLWLL